MKVVFHIGLPKAASSSLQIGLSTSKEIVFLGLYPTQNVAERVSLSPEFQMEVPYLNDSRIKEFYLAFGLKKYSANQQRLLYQSICSDYAEGQKTLFFSYEGLTSPMFSEVTPQVKLERLIECCDDADLLFVIRNQEDLIKSQYRDWPFDLTIKGGRGLGVNEWCLNELHRTDKMGPLFWFDLERLLEPFVLSNLPTERVHILLFEDFISERENFCYDLSQLLQVNPENLYACLENVRANRGVSARYNTYRKLRRIIPVSFSIRSILPNSVHNWLFRFLNRGGSESLKFNTQVKKELYAQFRDSNQRFAKSVGLSLSEKGYWI